MSRILIVTGGKIDKDFALSFLCKEKFDHTIVVDGALAFADAVSLSFDHLVGDFDTIAPEILEQYLRQDGITVHRFIPEKDYTDTDIAVKLAIDLISEDIDQFCEDIGLVREESDLEHEYSTLEGRDTPADIPQIWLLGAMGSRMDHSLANIQLLSFIRKAGMEGILVDAHNRIRLIGEGKTLLKRSALFGDFLSLIPLTERLSGVTLKGFKYETQDLEVILGETRCVSNEVEADLCTIEIGQGKAFLIEAKD